MFAENAYIAYLEGGEECVVVDPGSDHADIIQAIESGKLTPTALLNTHGHGDHIVGNRGIKEKWPEIPLLIGEKDADKLTDPHKNLSANTGFPFTSPPADRLLKEGEDIELAGMKLEVLEIPGHCIGHVVFVWKGRSPWIVFGGDVLFQGSIGRTDFPDGNTEDLLSAIRTKLFAMPDDTIVLPGHGQPTTIGVEKATNPFLQ